MKISQRLLTSAAALGLLITTVTSAGPAPITYADPLPDVAVKYDGYKLGANGEIDVAFGITNNQVADVNLTLNGRCVYNFLKDDSFSRMVDLPDTLGLFKTQVTPVPKLVVCYPNPDEYVVRVGMNADVAGGDADPSNNKFIFESATMLYPDVKVAFDSKTNPMKGAVTATFTVTNPTNNDAPIVRAIGECDYYFNETKAFSHQTLLDGGIISVPHGKTISKVITCPSSPGQYVGIATLTASVQKPMVDMDVSNNWASVKMP